MFKWWSRRQYRRLLEQHTTIKLHRDQLTKLRAEEIVAEISKANLVKFRLLEACENKIEHNSSLSFKLMIWSSIALAIILANIIGVKLELSLLGFKLSDADKLKEFIFLGTIIAGYIVDYLNEETKLLKQLEFAICEKISSGPIANLTTNLRPRLEINFYQHSWLDSKNHWVPYYKFWQSILPNLIDAVLVFSSLMVSLAFIHAIVAIDIWQNSNLPNPWNRILVVLFVLTILNAVLKAVLNFKPMSVTVRTKRDEFDKKFDTPDGIKKLMSDYLSKT